MVLWSFSLVKGHRFVLGECGIDSSKPDHLPRGSAHEVLTVCFAELGPHPWSLSS